MHKDYVVLKWEPPQSDGGADVKTYHVEKRDAATTRWTTAGSTDGLSLKVGKLYEGNEYLFRVAAENEIGVGEPAQLSRAVKAKLPFGTYNKRVQHTYHVTRVITSCKIMMTFEH